MKILHLNCVYNTGSTGKIMYAIHKGLQAYGAESVICYGRGKKVKEQNVYKTCSEVYAKWNHLRARMTGMIYGGCFFSTNKLIGIIKREKPDVVHLHCINGYFVNIYRLIRWLKHNKIPTILTLHAEFMYTGGCSHSLTCSQWRTNGGCGSSKCPQLRIDVDSRVDRTKAMWRRMKKAFEGFDNGLVVASVSPWLNERAKNSPILQGKEHRVVLNGVDTSVFYWRGEESSNDLRQELGVGTRKVVLHVTPNFNDLPNHIKGGYYVIELAKKMPNVLFFVAGMAKTGMELPSNVILLGRIEEQDRLARLYAMADLTLLTSEKETFSMVTAESLCCGTPVAGFKAGAPELIAIDEYSSFVEYADIDMLQRKVEDYLYTFSFSKKEISQAGERTYSLKEMVRTYIEIAKELAE